MTSDPGTTVVVMSLEDELKKLLPLNALHVEARVKEHLADDAPSGEQAVILLDEVVFPVIANVYDALYRVAREVDALRAGQQGG
jgi:hypothetical protein